MAADAWRLSRGGWVRAGLGIAVGLAGLLWIFHDVELSELRHDFLGIRWIWVVPALLCDTFGYYLQGVRWSLLLRPVGAVGARRATQAVYGGLFVNETLPMRLGEVVRAGIVARWLRVPVLSVLSTLAMERLFDGFWLALYIGVVAVAVPLPSGFVRAADLLGILVLAGAFVVLAFLFWPAPRAAGETEARTDAPEQGGSAGGRRAGLALALGYLAASLARMRTDFRGISRSPTFVPSFLLSSLPQAAESFAIWLLLRAYGIPLTVWAGMAAALILRLGTAVPSSPGNLGTWQLVCVVALSILGVPKAQAAGFSLVAFVLLTVPLWALGWWALTRAGLTLSTALARRPTPNETP